MQDGLSEAWMLFMYIGLGDDDLLAMVPVWDDFFQGQSHQALSDILIEQKTQKPLKITLPFKLYSPL